MLPSSQRLKYMTASNPTWDYTNRLDVSLIEGGVDTAVVLKRGKASAYVNLYKQIKWTKESAGQKRIFINKKND